MFLPWITFAILFAALYVRMIRANVMETMNEDYVRTARAKGAPESRVMRSHVLRNALLCRSSRCSEWTSASRSAARSSRRRSTAYPVSGRLRSERSVLNDLPIVMGVVVFATLAIIVFNLIIDLLYACHRPEDQADVVRIAARDSKSVDGTARSTRPKDVLRHRRRHRQGRRRSQLQRREGTRRSGIVGRVRVAARASPA